MLKRAIFRYKKQADDIKFSLEKAQGVLIEILSKFHSFCVENGIKYSLTYGSLLGACREGHIIEWDDDVDVMMDRENLLKLINNLNNLKEHGLSYYHYTTSKNIYTNEFRIYIDGFYRILSNNGKKYLTPLCIDIFNFERIDLNTDGSISARTTRYLEKINRLKKLLIAKESKYDSKNKFKGFLRSLKKVLLLPITSKYLHTKIDKYISFLHERDSAFALFSPFANQSFNVLFDDNLFGAFETIKFGDIDVYAISKHDDFLTKVYGNWKVPVDDSKGLTKSIEFIQRTNK